MPAGRHGTTRTTVLASAGDPWPLRLSAMLRARGEEVVVVLLDRGADLARTGHPAATAVADALAAGVEVLADVEALRRRGIAPTAVADGIKPTDIPAVGDLLVDATDKAVWL